MISKYVAFIVPFIVYSSTCFCQPSFQTVGYLTNGNPISHAQAASPDGRRVIGISTSGFSGTSGFYWTEQAGITAIPTIPGLGSIDPGGFSRSGNHILGVTGHPDGGSQGFIWSEIQGHILIGDLPGGSNNSSLSAINKDASFGVGGSSHDYSSVGAPIFRAVNWTPESGLTPMPLPNDEDNLFNSRALNLLSDGRIFGYSASGRWIYSPFDDSFEMLLGAESMTRISADGLFLAGEASVGGGPRASYWTRESGIEFLPILDGHVYSNLRGMSDDGSVMVGKSVGHGSKLVVWIDQGEPIEIHDFATSLGLDMSDWRIVGELNVSADGSTIVGTAAHESWESGHLEGFVLTIPSPASTSILAFGLIACRRKR